MEEALLKLVVTIPSAAAVIVTVILFLKAQRSQNEGHQQLQKELNERSTKCHEECTNAIRENQKAVSENTKVLAQLTTMIAKIGDDDEPE